MKAATVLEKMFTQRQENEKEQILKELSALLLTTNYAKERTYLDKAIDYIERH
jgi:mannitol/fructose-specific phosphotransferase system IIA component (Ntr-type)